MGSRKERKDRVRILFVPGIENSPAHCRLQSRVELHPSPAPLPLCTLSRGNLTRKGDDNSLEAVSFEVWYKWRSCYTGETHEIFGRIYSSTALPVIGLITPDLGRAFFESSDRGVAIGVWSDFPRRDETWFLRRWRNETVRAILKSSFNLRIIRPSSFNAFDTRIIETFRRIFLPEFLLVLNLLFLKIIENSRLFLAWFVSIFIQMQVIIMRRWLSVLRLNRKNSSTRWYNEQENLPPWSSPEKQPQCSQPIETNRKSQIIHDSPANYNTEPKRPRIGLHDVP